LAERQGATLIREIATKVRDEGDYVEVVTDIGQIYRTRKVLVATGAFSNGFDLCPRPLALRLKIEFVVLAEISPTEAERLHEMPPVIYLLDSPSLAEVYLLPPVSYPDGKIYLKLGANTIADRYVEILSEICDWYRAGDSAVMLPQLQRALLEMMPNVQVSSWHTHRCVITRTAHGYPYLDTLVPDKIYVAVGGNGQAAQAADAIGQIAAELVSHDAWQDALDPTLFQVRFADEPLAWTSRPLFQQENFSPYNLPPFTGLE
jgi:sarcosine oxidase